MKKLSTRELFQEATLSLSKDSQCLVKVNNSNKAKMFDVYCENKLHSGKEDNEESDLYKCRYCVKTYTSVTRYEVHFRTHTGEKPYKCKYCEKKFNENGNLKAHLRIHTGERPFKCTFEGCNLAFKTKGQLNDHFNRHSNLRPFKCLQCSSAFNRNNRLKIHMMIHSGEKPFQCTYQGCCKYFREKGNLMSHLKKHHKQEQEKKDSSEAIKESSLNSTSSNNDSSSNDNGLIKILYDKEAEKNNDNLFDLNELNCYTYSDNQDDQ